jgi:hypothetical protein
MQIVPPPPVADWRPHRTPFTFKTHLDIEIWRGLDERRPQCTAAVVCDCPTVAAGWSLWHTLHDRLEAMRADVEPFRISLMIQQLAENNVTITRT